MKALPTTDGIHIRLFSGEAVMVDPEDYPVLMMYRWHRTCKGYAATCPRPGKTVFMHRFLMGEPEGFQIDHIDGNKLDNRKANLRLATNAENCRTVRRKGSTGFRGVLPASNGKWQAAIMHNYRRFHLGVYESPEMASAAYQGAARVLYGEFLPIDMDQRQQQ